jgi:hypothetical protein
VYVLDDVDTNWLTLDVVHFQDQAVRSVGVLEHHHVKQWAGGM